MTKKKEDHADTPPLTEFVSGKVEQVAGKLHNSGFGIDPVTIITIIVAVVNMLKQCGLTAEQAHHRGIKPGPLGLIALRRVIRRTWKNAEADDAEAIEAALLETATETSVEEFGRLLKEV